MNNLYDYILRFDMDKHSKVEVDALLIRIKELITKEGFNFEKEAKTNSRPKEK